MRIIAIVVGLIALIIVVFAINEYIQPNSTASIEIVGHNTARLEPGQRLVVHDRGKNPKYWTVKYNLDETVSSDCGIFCRNEKKSLCGVGCTIQLDTGMFINSFKITDNGDGTINVRWPDGYDRD